MQFSAKSDGMLDSAGEDQNLSHSSHHAKFFA